MSSCPNKCNCCIVNKTIVPAKWVKQLNNCKKLEKPCKNAHTTHKVLFRNKSKKMENSYLATHSHRGWRTISWGRFQFEKQPRLGCDNLPTDEKSAKEIALSLGLTLGGNGYDFAGDYSTKGLYSYRNGYYKGQAFFGRGGTIYEMTTQLDGNKYRPCKKSSCSSTIQEVNTISSEELIKNQKVSCSLPTGGNIPENKYNNYYTDNNPNSYNSIGDIFHQRL